MVQIFFYGWICLHTSFVYRMDKSFFVCSMIRKIGSYVQRLATFWLHRILSLDIGGMDGLSCKNIWSSPHSPTFAQARRNIFKLSGDKQMHLCVIYSLIIMLKYKSPLAPLAPYAQPGLFFSGLSSQTSFSCITQEHSITN